LSSGVNVAYCVTYDPKYSLMLGSWSHRKGGAG